MNTKATLGLCAVAATACFALACQESAERYEMFLADGKPLPLIVQADSVCLTQLMGGAVDLERKHFKITYNLRKVCPTGSTPLPLLSNSGRFDRDDLYIQFRDSAGAALERGEIRGDTITLQGPTRTVRFLKQ